MRIVHMNNFGKYLFLMGLFLFAGHISGWAARNAKTNYSTDGVEHRISFGLGGGIALSMGETKDFLWQDASPYYEYIHPDGTADLFTPYRAASPLNHKTGANALFDLGYELRKKRFIFGFGVRANFYQLRTTLDTMEIAFGRPYAAREALALEAKYNYCFAMYDDRLQVLECAVPVYFGMEMGQYMYFHVGAVAGYTCIARHKTAADLKNELTLLPFIGSEAGRFYDLPTHGAFSMEHYAYSGAVKNVNQWTLTPTLEIGARFQLTKRVQMRLGIYAGYALQLGWNQDKVNNVPIVDFADAGKEVCCTGVVNYMYSEAEQQTMQNTIRQNIIFNSPLYSELQQSAFSHIVVGIKWTTLIQVGKVKRPCLCSSDLDFHPRQAKKHHKHK